MVKRVGYLNELNKWKDERVIKVVTGVRRCGKSTLLEQFRAELLGDGVPGERVLSVNFEDIQFEELKDYRKLYDYVVQRLQADGMNYVFLDEVQLVPDFQKAVDSLYIRENVDLYITGSNAYLLSGELATMLSGRSVEIKMLPLSFAEYCELKQSNEIDALFADYLRFGALPYIASMIDPGEKADAYLEGIYNTILVKDIELRQNRRERESGKRKVTDIALLKSIAQFLANSVGSPVSVKGIADYLTSSGRKVSQNTVADYVEALVEPFVFYPADRYDVLGKQLLKQNKKLYIVDLGIRRYLLSQRNYDLGYSIENVVYLELLRRGNRVCIGKVGKTEVDFVTEVGDVKHYYQVTASMTEEKTFEREMAPLRAIKDNYPKTVLTLDRFTTGNYDGIEVLYLPDWLMM